MFLFHFADTSLIKLSKGERNITDITYASFNPHYMFNFAESKQVCKLLKGTLASLQQMQAAWDKGFQECRRVTFTVFRENKARLVS